MSMDNETKQTIEKMKLMKPKTRFETYQDDLTKYLLEKLQGTDVKASVAYEIAQYAMVQTQIVVNDAVMNERNRVFREVEKIARRPMTKRRENDTQ